MKKSYVDLKLTMSRNQEDQRGKYDLVQAHIKLLHSLNKMKFDYSLKLSRLNDKTIYMYTSMYSFLLNKCKMKR